MRRYAALFLMGVLLSSWTARADVDVAPLRPLPVLDGGRVKPIDTFARETVRFVTGSENFGIVEQSAEGQKIGSAVDPLGLILDWSVRSREWEQRPLLYVPLLELRAKLNLPQTGKWISPRSLRTNADFRQWVQTLLDRHAQAERDGEEAAFTRLEDGAMELMRRLQLFDSVSSLSAMAILPDSANSDHWFNLFELTSGDANLPARGIGAAWQTVAESYRSGDGFSQAAEKLIEAIRSSAGAGYADAARMEREVFYNRIKPFRIAWIAYLFSAIVLVASNMSRRRFVHVLAVTIFAFAICLHIASFGFRCSITGWAPVTNMYETVIWVALIAAIVALVLELIYRRRVSAIAGAIVALLATVVADAMPPEYGNSIRNLTPVLRSNYWLVIHVLTIVSSYAAFALAMVLGDIVLVQYGFLGRRRGGSEDHKKAVESIRVNLGFIYRSVQVGVLLVAAGTILGGLWADVSWGRFWGWDPKEVWALIVLLTYLALLHGRFAGWIGQFGLAAGAVVCFTAVLMSWYGVNFVLGTGLHAYGFGTGGQGYVGAFVFAQWVFVGIIRLLYRRRATIAESTTGSTTVPAEMNA